MSGCWVQIHDDDVEGTHEEIALIGIPHETFADRFGISFTSEERFDAPAPTAYANIELQSGTQFILQHHCGHPEPGVWVLARTDADVDTQRTELAGALPSTLATTALSGDPRAGSTRRPASPPSHRPHAADLALCDGSA